MVNLRISGSDALTFTEETLKRSTALFWVLAVFKEMKRMKVQ